MAMESQMSRRDLPTTDEDELPDYELPGYQAEAEADADDLPTYERGRSISFPINHLQFRQMNRKLLCLESLEEEHPAKYKIATKTRKPFSGKPDMVLYLESESKDMAIGAFEFDDSTTLPWMPRANVSVDVAGQGSKSLRMESRNFSDWTLTSDGATFKWTLQERPTSLALIETSSGFVVARFTYSMYGTTANKGAAIGDLAIFAAGEHGLTTEVIISSCTIVMKYWAKMGRHHKQDYPIHGRYSYGTGVTLAAGAQATRSMSLWSG